MRAPFLVWSRSYLSRIHHLGALALFGSASVQILRCADLAECRSCGTQILRCVDPAAASVADPVNGGAVAHAARERRETWCAGSDIVCRLKVGGGWGALGVRLSVSLGALWPHLCICVEVRGRGWGACSGWWSRVRLVLCSAGTTVHWCHTVTCACHTFALAVRIENWGILVCVLVFTYTIQYPGVLQTRLINKQLTQQQHNKSIYLLCFGFLLRRLTSGAAATFIMLNGQPTLRNS